MRRTGAKPLKIESKAGLALPAGGAADPSAPVEGSNRRNPRRRILKRGIIAYSGRHLTFECAVRDLSDQGAKLIVTDHRQVPDSFELLVELDGFEADCEVVWRRSDTLGVRFTAPLRRVEPRRIQVLAVTGPRMQPSLRRRSR